MKTLAQLLCSILCVLAHVGVVSAADAITADKTPAGIAYVLVQVPDTEWVSIRVAWPTDWPFRTERNQAAPYVGSEAILTGGAEGYPPEAVIEEFADLRAEGSITYDALLVYGSLAVPRANLGPAVTIANAHLRAPAFGETWVQRARAGFASRLQEELAGGWGRSFDVMRWALLRESPLRRALNAGPPERIAEVTRDDLLAWHKSAFFVKGAIVVVAGDITAEEAGRAVDALFAGLPEGTGITQSAPPVDVTPRRILLHDPSAAVSLLSFVGPKPTKRLDEMADDLVIHAGLNATDGPLFETVRTGLRAAYRFSSVYSDFIGTDGLLIFMGEVETAKLAAAETSLRNAYAAFTGADQFPFLDSLRAPLAAEMEDLMKYPADVSLIVLRQALIRQGLPRVPTREVARVTQDSLLHRLRQFPAANALTVIAISPDEDAIPGACVIRKPEEAVSCR